MRKATLFPFWTDLERVLAPAQVRTAGNVSFTLVSMELYPVYGFLLTFNVESDMPDPAFTLSRRGWVRAAAIDDNGRRYSSMLTMISSIAHEQRFRGRAVVPFLPHVASDVKRLSVTINHIEWEYLNDNDRVHGSDMLAGPWLFDITL